MYLTSLARFLSILVNYAPQRNLVEVVFVYDPTHCNSLISYLNLEFSGREFGSKEELK